MFRSGFGQGSLILKKLFFRVYDRCQIIGKRLLLCLLNGQFFPRVHIFQKRRRSALDGSCFHVDLPGQVGHHFRQGSQYGFPFGRVVCCVSQFTFHVLQALYQVACAFRAGLDLRTVCRDLLLGIGKSGWQFSRVRSQFRYCVVAGQRQGGNGRSKGRYRCNCQNPGVRRNGRVQQRHGRLGQLDSRSRYRQRPYKRSNGPYGRCDQRHQFLIGVHIIAGPVQQICSCLRRLGQRRAKLIADSDFQPLAGILQKRHLALRRSIPGRGFVGQRRVLLPGGIGRPNGIAQQMIFLLGAVQAGHHAHQAAIVQAQRHQRTHGAFFCGSKTLNKGGQRPGSVLAPQRSKLLRAHSRRGRPFVQPVSCPRGGNALRHVRDLLFVGGKVVAQIYDGTAQIAVQAGVHTRHCGELRQHRSRFFTGHVGSSAQLSHDLRKTGQILLGNAQLSAHLGNARQLRSRHGNGLAHVQNALAHSVQLSGAHIAGFGHARHGAFKFNAAVGAGFQRILDLSEGFHNPGSGQRGSQRIHSVAGLLAHFLAFFAGILHSLAHAVDAGGASIGAVLGLIQIFARLLQFLFQFIDVGLGLVGGHRMPI